MCNSIYVYYWLLNFYIPCVCTGFLILDKREQLICNHSEWSNRRQNVTCEYRVECVFLRARATRVRVCVCVQSCVCVCVFVLYSCMCLYVCLCCWMCVLCTTILNEIITKMSRVCIDIYIFAFVAICVAVCFAVCVPFRRE